MKDSANKFQSIISNKGSSLYDLSTENTVMLIFLRHFGCVFCQEALQDISNNRSNWEKEGIKLVLVHPSDEASGDKYSSQFGLSDIDRISDPDCKLYELFGLVKGSFSQLFGLQTMIRGFQVATKGNLPSLKQVGDGFQMPGIFLIRNGNIRERYIHKNASDRPDYNELIRCCAA